MAKLKFNPISGTFDFVDGLSGYTYNNGPVQAGHDQTFVIEHPPVTNNRMLGQVSEYYAPFGITRTAATFDLNDEDLYTVEVEGNSFDFLASSVKLHDDAPPYSSYQVDIESLTTTENAKGSLDSVASWIYNSESGIVATSALANALIHTGEASSPDLIQFSLPSDAERSYDYNLHICGTGAWSVYKDGTLLESFSGKVATSTDSVVTNPLGIAYPFNCMASNPSGLLVAIYASSGLFTYKWYKSTNNGVSFDSGTDFIVDHMYAWQAMVWHIDRFVAINGGTAGIHSTNGTTWTKVTLPVNSTWQKMHSNGTVILALSSASVNTILRSTDGITFTSVTMPVTAIWQDMAYSPVLNRWILITSAGVTYYSDNNGTSWTACATPPNSTTNYLCWGNGYFVLVAVNPAGGALSCARSTNGATFTLIVEYSATVRSGMVFFNDMFYIFIANQNKYYSSSTGASGSWTLYDTTNGGVSSAVKGQYATYGSHLIAPNTAANSNRRFSVTPPWSSLATTVNLNKDNVITIAAASGSVATLRTLRVDTSATPPSTASSGREGTVYTQLPAFVTPRYLLTPVTDIEAQGISKIVSISASTTVPASTSIYMLVSFDEGVTWKKWSGGAWVTVSDVSIRAILNAEGQAPATLLSGFANWTPSGTEKIVFALDMRTSDTTVSPTLSSLDMVVDINGMYKPVTMGVDWEFYPISPTQTVFRRLKVDAPANALINLLVF